MENEKILYKIALAITSILLLILILLIKPTTTFDDAIGWILAIALFIVEIKIIIQMRKLKQKQDK